MIEIPADQHRDPRSIARLAGIAAHILARHNVDFAAARRTGGWSNATWLAGGLALCIAVEPGTDNIRCEARLASLLPSAVDYPQIIDTGVTDGHGWLLAKEVPGRNLGELWPVLDWETRRVALRQLWAKAQAVHSVQISVAAAHARTESPFYASSPEEAAASLVRLEEAGVLAPRQAAVLQNALDRFWLALPSAPCVLNHGDFSIENALWDDGRVVALLDFEFAVMAPIELDVNELLKCAYAPPERDDPLPDAGGAGRQRLREAVADIASATVVTPGGSGLLLGYAILLELWSMENWLSKWDGVEPFAQWQPYRTLTALADGAGGYLAPVLARLAGGNGRSSSRWPRHLAVYKGMEPTAYSVRSAPAFGSGSCPALDVKEMHMEKSEKESLIERYVRTYNGFDINGMVALLHPECTFQNVSGGEVNASTSGVPQFRELAEKSKELFSSRCQTITAYKHDGESVTVEIDYEGVLKVDIPNGPKAGETLKLKGKSVFRIRDSLIRGLTDYS